MGTAPIQYELAQSLQRCNLQLHELPWPGAGCSNRGLSARQADARQHLVHEQLQLPGILKRALQVHVMYHASWTPDVKKLVLRQ